MEAPALIIANETSPSCKAATLCVIMPRQKLGQHFLSNPAWRERIAQTLPTAPDSTWLEVGAGHGEMTELLAASGAYAGSRRVIAIETDPALAAALRTRFASQTNVEIVESDILSANLSALVTSRSAQDSQHTTQAVQDTVRPHGFVGRGFNRDINSRAPSGASAPEGHNKSIEQAPSAESNRFRVYGNLPYYITSPILAHLFRFAAQIESIHIVIQLEVAQRIVATPHHREYAYLSALCQYFTRPEIILRIPPGAFRPPPKVHSALVAMQLPGERARLGIENDSAFLEFLQHSFAQKRKTLRNNLKSIFGDEEIAAALASCKLTTSSRAEELSLAQFAQLYRALAPPR